MLRSFVVGLFFLSFISARAQSPKCFDAANWINGCIDRMKAGGEMKSTLVDVRFPGEKESPISDNWVVKNFESVNEGGFSFEEDARATQDACKSLTTSKSTLDIVAFSPTHLDLMISPDTFLKDKSGLEVVILSTMLANLKMKMQEMPGESESIRFDISQVTDNQPVESSYLIRCGGKIPEREKVSASVEALTARHGKLVAAGVKPTDEKEARALAYITNKGRMVFNEKDEEEAKQEYKDAYGKFLTDKGKVEKDLETFDEVKLQREFLKEKGKSLSIDARMSVFNELRFARLLLNPKDEEKLFKDNPKIKESIAEIRSGILESQKVIAAQLDMPDGYWNYPDVPNDVLEDFAEAIGKALGEGLEKAIEEGIKKAFQAPPAEQQML